MPLAELLGRVFPNLTFVRVARQDKFRQAISLWKAVQTQAWRKDVLAGESTHAREPQFSFRAINYLVRLLTAHDASWDAYFLGLGVEPLKVTYEDLAEDPEPVIRTILESFGVPAPEPLTISAPRLQIQADSLSEEWLQRVQQHLSALETARRGGGRHLRRIAGADSVSRVTATITDARSSLDLHRFPIYVD